MKKYTFSLLLEFRYFLVIVSPLLLVSCTKFLDVGDPPDKVTADYVYGNNKSAIGVLNGIYYDMQSSNGFAQGKEGIAFNTGLSADEFNVVDNSIYKAAYSNNEAPDYHWTRFYGLLYRINSAIEGLEGAVALRSSVKQQLLGEAFFLRAFCYFYLVNLFGDVPLVTTSNFKTNAILPRLKEESIYDQIVKDLLTSKELLAAFFVDISADDVTQERTRPNKWAAIALLSRVYLYMEKWALAESESSLVIGKEDLFSLSGVDQVFSKNSSETIWQIQPISKDGTFLNVEDAQVYIFRNGAPDIFENPVSVGNLLLSSFESNDSRKSEWIGVDSSTGASHNYFYKYKVNSVGQPSVEYLMVFRLSEQYLIRAEANAQQGKILESQSDLNKIRERAGLQITSANDKASLLSAILQERKVELFTEWGHRWFDLKRCHKIDETMKIVCPIKGGIWESYKKLYPIPVTELRYNRNLRQNDGYPAL